MCYFRIHKAISGGSGKFLDDLNTSFGSGVLTCDFDGHEFKAFMKWLMKNYFRVSNLVPNKLLNLAILDLDRKKKIIIVSNDINNHKT